MQFPLFLPIKPRLRNIHLPSKRKICQHCLQDLIQVDNSAGFFQQDEKIGWTIGFGLTICIILLLSVILLSLRKRVLMVWKKSEYLVISSVGMCFIIASAVMTIWGVHHNVFGLFFHLGMDCTYWPLCIRTWRIVCIHSKTLAPGCPCACVSPYVVRARGHRWMLTRIACTLGPSVLVTVGAVICIAVYPASQEALDWVLLAKNSTAVAFVTGVTVWHVAIRKKIIYEEVNESRSLVAGCTCAILQFLGNTFSFFVLLQRDMRSNVHLCRVHFAWTEISVASVFVSTVGLCFFQLLRAKHAPPHVAADAPRRHSRAPRPSNQVTSRASRPGTLSSARAHSPSAAQATEAPAFFNEPAMHPNPLPTIAEET